MIVHGSGSTPTSAKANTGNAFYYMDDYEAALIAWRAAASVASEHPNIGPWSNIVAALVASDRPREALEEGERARAWAEKSGRALIDTYPYAGILENSAFARMQLGDLDGALADFATARAFKDDDLTKQNLALALVVAGKSKDARDLLRLLAPPLDAGEARSDRVAVCVYLLWALAIPPENLATRGANLSAFIGEQRSASELGAMTMNDVAALANRAAEALPNSNKPCGTLAKIASLRDLLSAKKSGSLQPSTTPVGRGATVDH